VKALTVCQPYAELIARGDKTVENRVWEPSHRGLLLIHAGKSLGHLAHYEKTVGPAPDKLVYGAIVCVTKLVDVVKYDAARPKRVPRGFEWLADDSHAEGPRCLILEDTVRLLKPIAVVGKQNIWEVDSDVALAVEKQLAKIKKQGS